MGLTEPLSDIDSKPIEWIWESRIPRGIMTVIEGDGGIGKSSLSLEIASALSTGRRLPGNEFNLPPCHTLFLTTEDDPRRTAVIAERVKAMGGNPKLIHFFSAPDEIDLARDTAAVEAHIAELHSMTGIPVGLLIIDPLTDYLHGGTGHEQSVKRSLDPIRRVVAKCQLGWIAIRHLTKDRGSASTAGLGSVKIRNMARSQLLLAEHPDDRGVVVVASSKRNWCAAPTSLMFRCADNRVEWLGECPYSADQLLRPDGYNKGKTRARAREFLEAELSMGALPIGVVWKLAKEIRVSGPTLNRAADDLGVEHFREGFPRNTFWWFLPGKRHKNPAYDMTPPAAEEASPGGSAKAKQPPKMHEPRTAQPDPQVVEAAKVLGVAVNATEEEVISAFRSKVREVHPDVGGDSEATRRVIDAREVMLTWWNLHVRQAA